METAYHQYTWYHTRSLQIIDITCLLLPKNINQFVCLILLLILFLLITLKKADNGRNDPANLFNQSSRIVYTRISSDV